MPHIKRFKNTSHRIVTLKIVKSEYPDPDVSFNGLIF